MLLRDHVAFYPAALDQCTIDRKHAPRLYSSWITADLRGTFKGGTRQHGLVNGKTVVEGR